MNIKGIDVSVWQGKIDWKKVKASGIVFAMIRVGYGSSQGNDCKMDTYFKANVEGALAAGVEVGILRKKRPGGRQRGGVGSGADRPV